MKKNVFFRALPELPKPPHDPNSGNLVLFFPDVKIQYLKVTWGEGGGLGNSGNARKKTFFFQLISSLTVYDEMYPMVGRGLFYAGKQLAPVFHCHVLGLAWLVPPQSMFPHNKCPI